MNAPEPQETVVNASPALPKKPTAFLSHLLLLLTVLAGIACGFFIYADRQQHQRLQQIDHSLQQTLTNIQQNLHKNESELATLRTQQLNLANALQKIQTTSLPTVTPESRPDISAAFEALSTLDGALDTLPWAEPSLSIPTPSQPEVATTWGSRILHILQPIWHQLVIVRHRGEESGRMTPAIRQLVILRLHTDLDAAKWAVLHHDAIIYKTALNNARHTLGHYFTAETAKPVLDHLALLINTGIPENPTVH